MNFLLLLYQSWGKVSMVLSKIVSEKYWKAFVEKEKLSQEQQEKFLKYLQMLQKANERFNITRIISAHDVVAFHFQDSLVLRRFFDLSAVNGLADIGSGGGFPGIPLAIVNPKVNFFLIEVTTKKVEFLRQVAKELLLQNIEVVQCDWRTFLRTTKHSIDIFAARASLSVKELIRAFSPQCFYNSSTLVYWASKNWEPERNEAPLILKQDLYMIKNKQRKLFIFKKM